MTYWLIDIVDIYREMAQNVNYNAKMSHHWNSPTYQEKIYQISDCLEKKKDQFYCVAPVISSVQFI